MADVAFQAKPKERQSAKKKRMNAGQSGPPVATWGRGHVRPRGSPGRPWPHMYGRTRGTSSPSRDVIAVAVRWSASIANVSRLSTILPMCTSTDGGWEPLLGAGGGGPAQEGLTPPPDLVDREILFVPMSPKRRILHTYIYVRSYYIHIHLFVTHVLL